MTETFIARVTKADPNWGEHEWFEHGRQWWRANLDRATACEQLFIIDRADTVKAIANIEGATKDPDSGRVSFTAQFQPNNPWTGTQIQRPTTRNPITYTTNPQPTTTR